MSGLAACATTATGQSSFFARTGLPIGLQVYTLGEQAGQDIDATFAAIAAIGFREIELPGLLGHKPPQVRAAAQRAGLSIGSIHLPITGHAGSQTLTFNGAPSAIADALGELGASWAVAPMALIPSDFRPAPGQDIGQALSRAVHAAGPDLWKQTAEILNRQAERLEPLGIRVGYHNHNLEFAPLGDTNGWEIIRDETDEALVSFEIDLGWVATAGLDPLVFLREHSGRIALIHVKDVAKGNKVGHDLSMMPTEVGSGTLAWDQLLPAAYAAGARHFYVEQEPPFSIPRIEAARRGYQYLSSLAA
ncbi:MAG: sugar phosphate isomerase/epimerase [Novosphingobium sp.]|nr:sugar phosphate isomerase/epimerase [Novosphingobium sp.]MCP5400855.1 sugar phosphate isomerase/epimerase [Novosphingobium sp.]